MSPPHTRTHSVCDTDEWCERQLPLYHFMSTPQVTNGNPHLSPLPINSKQTQCSLPVDCKQRNIDVFPFPITNFVYKPTGSGKANVKTGSEN